MRAGVRYFGIGGDFLLFALSQSLQIGASWTEAQFAIKPERTRFDCLLVVVAELIGIDRDTRRTHVVTEAAQDLRVDPSRFAAAESVEGVEADLHPLAEADGFDVVDGHAILQRQARDVGAQRQTAIGRQVPEIDDSTPRPTSARTTDRGSPSVVP